MLKTKVDVNEKVNEKLNFHANGSMLVKLNDFRFDVGEAKKCCDFWGQKLDPKITTFHILLKYQKTIDLIEYAKAFPKIFFTVF